jgi:hypothetical protein
MFGGTAGELLGHVPSGLIDEEEGVAAGRIVRLGNGRA